MVKKEQKIFSHRDFTNEPLYGHRVTERPCKPEQTHPNLISDSRLVLQTVIHNTAKVLLNWSFPWFPSSAKMGLRLQLTDSPAQCNLWLSQWLQLHLWFARLHVEFAGRGKQWKHCRIAIILPWAWLSTCCCCKVRTNHQKKNRTLTLHFFQKLNTTNLQEVLWQSLHHPPCHGGFMVFCPWKKKGMPRHVTAHARGHHFQPTAAIRYVGWPDKYCTI